MKQRIYERRKRTLHLLSICDSKTAAVQIVAREFNCPESTIWSEIRNMKNWSGALKYEEALAERIAARMEFLNTEANMLILDDKPKAQLTPQDKFAKIGALNTSLRITVEEKRFGQELGWIERKPEQFDIKQSIELPFWSLPEITQSFAKELNAQKAERDARTKAAAETGR